MDSAKACAQIRKIIKERGYTQEEFARVIGVSKPTLSRWLKGEGLLFQDLNKMLEKLGVKLSELAMLSEIDMTNKFTYTIQQENAFVNSEGLLAFFDQLLNGKTTSNIARAFKLSDKSINSYLSKLDKLKLIEWLPNNKAKIIVSGEPSWIVGGPLSQKFRKQIINEHIQNHLDDRERLRIGVYSLTDDSSQKLNEKLQEVLESIRTLEIKDSNNVKSKKLTTVILGYGQNDVPILTKIPNR